MAYYRRRYRRKNYGRKRRQVPWYKKKYNVAQVAGAALRGVNYIRGLVNSEKFKHDLQGSISASTSGTVNSLVAIAQGDNDGNRTGNSIYIRSISMKATIEHNSLGAAVQKVRVMWVIDKQCISDTTPAASDILDTTGTSIAPLSMLNDTTVGRFSILKSKLFNVSTERPCISFAWNLNLRHHVRYNGTTGSDVQKGAIFQLVITDVDTNVPTLNRFTRVSYHDN